MKIGFIGFGEVASTLSKGLLENEVDVFTCIEGRSSKTQKLAREIEINLCKSNREIAETCDIIISAVTPASAIKTAQEVGKYVKGIYVDINNISPATARKALSFIKNKKTADASIIGAIRKGFDVSIIASGPFANELTQLNEYGMNIDVVGMEIGQASAVKMFRSSFTKGISALLFETLYAAYNMGIDEEVLNYIAETECKGFNDAAVSRVISSAYHAKRRHEEMGEVIELLSESEDPKMSKAAEEFFKMIYSKLGELDKRPENYTEIFKHIKEKNGFKDYQ